MTVTCTQQDLDAAWNLLKRIYSEEDRGLHTMVYGKSAAPILRDPSNYHTNYLTKLVNKILTSTTINTTVGEWSLTPTQVNQLQMDDSRIATLLQRLSDRLASHPTIFDLRLQREIHRLNQ